MPVGRNMLRITEGLLGILLEGGMPGATAAWAVDLLTLYVTALAAEKSAWQTQDDALRPMAQAIGAATAEEYPHIHALHHLPRVSLSEYNRGQHGSKAVTLGH